VVGEPPSSSELRPPANAARYDGMRTVTGISYLFVARARPAVFRADVFFAPRERVLPAVFLPVFLFSVSPCLRGRFSPPPTTAARTQTTAGSPSMIACQDLPSSLDPYTLPLLVPK